VATSNSKFGRIFVAVSTLEYGASLGWYVVQFG